MASTFATDTLVAKLLAQYGSSKGTAFADLWQQYWADAAGGNNGGVAKQNAALLAHIGGDTTKDFGTRFDAWATALGFNNQRVAAYAASVLADSPAAYWKLGETSGSTAVDSSTNALNGSYVGANPSLNQPGATGLGGAFLTNPQTNYFSRAESALLHPTTGLTLEAWIYLPSLPTDAQSTVVSKAGSYYLWINTTGNLLGYDFFVGGNGNKSAASTSAVPTTTWTHVACAGNDTTGGTYYINGVAAGTYTNAFTGNWTDASNGPLLSGSEAGSSRPFTARVQHVAVYLSKLSAARLAAHYTAATT